MDRPLCATVLRVLYLEWGNPRCCVPTPRALTGDCIFRSAKNSPQGGDKKDEKYWDGYKQEEVHSKRSRGWKPGGIMPDRCVIFREVCGTDSGIWFLLPVKSRQQLNGLHRSGTVPADLTAIRLFIPFFTSL